MPPYEISTDASRLDITAIHGYLSTAYWSVGVPLDTVERAVANSLCVGAYLNGAQIGFARVVTDKATFAYVADVYVLEEHRGKGISKAMLHSLFQLQDLQGLRRLLLVTRDAHALYETFGFKQLSAPTRFMELINPTVYWPLPNSAA